MLHERQMKLINFDNTPCGRSKSSALLPNFTRITSSPARMCRRRTKNSKVKLKQIQCVQMVHEKGMKINKFPVRNIGESSTRTYADCPYFIGHTVLQVGFTRISSDPFRFPMKTGSKFMTPKQKEKSMYTQKASCDDDGESATPRINIEFLSMSMADAPVWPGW